MRVWSVGGIGGGVLIIGDGVDLVVRFGVVLLILKEEDFFVNEESLEVFLGDFIIGFFFFEFFMLILNFDIDSDGFGSDRDGFGSDIVGLGRDENEKFLVSFFVSFVFLCLRMVLLLLLVGVFLGIVFFLVIFFM